MSETLRQLLRSRKFLMALMDAGASLVLYFAGRYAPDALPDARFLILTLQPVALIVIAAFAYEDAQIKAAIAAQDRKYELENQTPYRAPS